MRLPPSIRKIHDKITMLMSKSKFVEYVLIATVTEDNGEEWDCIYCTIIRNALIFGCLGLVVGYFIGAC